MSRQGITFRKKITILSSASAVGGLEAKGPLAPYFDLSCENSKFGMDTWEKAEAEMIRTCAETALKKGKKSKEEIDLAFAGDLTNQCAATCFGLKDKEIPHIGLYGACSTFALSLGMASIAIESNLAKTALCGASSHYCSAERQYRFPLEYGCQRTPTAQTTVTGAGCMILEESEENRPYVQFFLPGMIRDLGITDANNMGAAMAPACADTVIRYFQIHDEKPEVFDAIITGDLGFEGHRLFLKLCQDSGLILKNSTDCGKLIFDPEKQTVNSGGSGCGCSACVFSGFYMDRFNRGEIRDVLFIGTGALLNPATVLQNETIPGIAHLVRIRKDR